MQVGNSCVINERIKDPARETQFLKSCDKDFPGGPVDENPPCNVGDTGSIPGQGTEIPDTAGSN